MPKIFTPENRNDIRKELLECGFGLLKQGGLTAVNIDVITERCFIAKGTFDFSASRAVFTLFSVLTPH